jgi:hypothetical protein
MVWGVLRNLKIVWVCQGWHWCIYFLSPAHYSKSRQVFTVENSKGRPLTLATVLRAVLMLKFVVLGTRTSD